MPTVSVIDQYLQRYAEPEVVLADRVNGRFRHALVVPCYDESAQFLNRLSVPGDDQTLTILVVNAPDDADIEPLQRTRELLTALQTQRRPRLLVVDRVTRPIARKQGVGLARKIGADIALALIARGAVTTPWIFCTDADARLPADYFSAPTGDTGTVLFGFRHHSDDPELLRRAELYELHLRHYALGLRRAGSSYGFVSLGSIIAVAAQSYAAVRGVPRRNAAEDFYLLNKLAKVAPIRVLTKPVVTLDVRLSGRVPFGTGPALGRIPHGSEQYLSYAPVVFDILADTLRILQRLATTDEPERFQPEALQALNALGWAKCRAQLAELSSTGQRQRQLREWFDGFRIMRFVRLLSERHPNTPLLKTLRSQLAAPDYTPAAALLRRLVESEKPVTISPVQG